MGGMETTLATRLVLRENGTPTYRQVAEQIAAMIRGGDLALGERLPPDRTLARALGVSRTTVVSAYEELKAAGLVHGRQGSGTYVARPVGPGDNWAKTAMSIVPAATRHAGRTLSLSHSMPPVEGTPLLQMLHLATEVAEASPESLTEYLPAEGYPPLRHAIARWLAGQGMAVRAAEVLILSGSQQGIDLLARLLLRPGDHVAVEARCYSGALTTFRTAGARLLPIPIDADGMIVDGLAALLARYPVRAIYTVPTFHNPTSATMPLARRVALLEVARRHAVPIIEDSPFERLYFDQPPPPPLKALDRDGQVLHISSASKILGAGLRLGWLAAPASIISQVATLKRSADLHANTIGQVALHRFLDGNMMEPHLASLRRICQARAERLTAALARALPTVGVQTPRGGLCAWARLPDGVKAEVVLEAALERGVAFMPGSWFAVNGSDDGSLRLCFAGPPTDAVEEAVARLAEAVRAVGERDPSSAPVDRLVTTPPVV
jgi:2-aminoadipate transaminase